MLVVDFDAPDSFRAFARYDAARIEAAGADPAALLGAGHLAFTVDQGDATRYQGVVALTGQGLEAAAHEYFRQSEQIPTLVRLAVAQSFTSAGVAWRVGGLLTQFLPDSPERRRRADLDPGDAPPGAVRDEAPEDESWAEARALAGTVEAHELVDPTLSSERLLYRLFHERGVTVFQPRALREACRCSSERIRAMLRSFSAEDRRAMIGDDGKIGVTCEFCSSHETFEPAEFETGE
jgi:molecular chaperone Hsp33